MSDNDEERSAEAESTPTAAPIEPASEPSPRPSDRSPARAWRIGRLLLAPVLAATAVGLHFVLNVPKDLPPPPAKSDGKPKPKPKKKPARDDTKAAEMRSKAELEQAAARYRDTAFADEPIDSKWARRTKAVLNRAVVVAREAAFEGAPEPPRVIVNAIECRTVRCRFVIRSPYEHEVELMERSLEQMMTDGVPLWSSFESTANPLDPPRAKPKQVGAPKPPDVAIEVTVTLAADDVDAQGLSVPKAKPEPGAEPKARDPKNPAP